MLFFFAIAATVPLHFHFDAREFANAVYHTACVTGQIPCSEKQYQHFWKETYHSAAEDEARFQEFGRILDEVETAAGPGRPTPFLPNDFINAPGQKVRKRVLAAALASKSAAEFRQRAVAIIPPDKAAKLAAILDYFQKRLRPWWTATGQAMVKRNLRGIEKGIRASGAAVLAAEVATFLDSPGSFRDYYIHAVPSPDYDGTDENGTAVANQFCVEIAHYLKADDFPWVVVHELTHSLYEQAPQERKDALMRQFVESGDPSAQPFYMYLNEGMATAVELLLCERNGRTLADPYTDPFIPRLGRAILPLLRAALAQHKTLYEGFAAPYLAAGRSTLGDEADAPAFRFSCVEFLAEEEVRKTFLDRLPLRYFVTSDEARKQFARLGRLLMVRYEQLQLGGQSAGQVQELTRQHRGFVLVAQKEDRMDVVMAGRDNAALAELGKMWAESKEPAREGLIFTID